MPPIVWLLLGALLFFGGIAMTVVGHEHESAYAADPDCLPAITVDTPAHEGGKQCNIYVGKVEKAYTKTEDHTHRDSNGFVHHDTTTTHHVVVDAGGGSGKIFDIELEDEGDSPLYAHAEQNPGEKAVVETVHDDPAMIATGSGMLGSSAGDVHALKLIGIVVTIIGVILGLVGVFQVLRRRM